MSTYRSSCFSISGIAAAARAFALARRTLLIKRCEVCSFTKDFAITVPGNITVLLSLCSLMTVAGFRSLYDGFGRLYDELVGPKKESVSLQ